MVVKVIEAASTLPNLREVQLRIDQANNYQNYSLFFQENKLWGLGELLGSIKNLEVLKIESLYRYSILDVAELSEAVKLKLLHLSNSLFMKKI